MVQYCDSDPTGNIKPSWNPKMLILSRTVARFPDVPRRALSNRHHTVGSVFLLHLRTGSKNVNKKQVTQCTMDDRCYAPNLFPNFGRLLGLDNNSGQVYQLN